MDKKTIIENIFKQNLDIKSNEVVLIYTDGISFGEKITEIERARREKLPKIASEFAEIGKKFAAVKYIRYESVKEHGAEPPLPVWNSAFGPKVLKFIKENKLSIPIFLKTLDEFQKAQLYEFISLNNKECVNAVIALSNYSTSHTLFRDLLTGCGGARFASMPLFDESMFETALNAESSVLADFTLSVLEQLKDASIINVKAPNGTDMTFHIRSGGFMADTGMFNKRGAFGNLPAGEIYTAPLEGRTSGKFVMEYAPTRKLDYPITLYIDNGMVKYIEGNDKFKDHLIDSIKNNNLISNIAELGIGTNKEAKNILNILEAEKIFGSIHIALGDNSSFGGNVRVNFHEDFILFAPVIKVTTKAGKEFILKPT